MSDGRTEVRTDRRKDRYTAIVLPRYT